MANFKHCFKTFSEKIGFSCYLSKSGPLHFISKIVYPFTLLIKLSWVMSK